MILAADLAKAIWTAPQILPDILPSFVPYALVLSLFGAFVKWNGGIVLGALYFGLVICLLHMLKG